MKNNKSILILRAKYGITNSIKDVSILDGQPLYNKLKNYLTVGKGDTATAKDKPITVRELVGYFEDNVNITDKITTNEYSIKPSTSGVTHTLNIDNKNGFIKLRTNNIDRLSINNGGNVGIGTDPDEEYRLNILGDINELGSITASGIVTITDETPSTDTLGALKVTGGVKAKNLYIKSEDLTNTIEGTTNTIKGTTNIIEGGTLNIEGTTTIDANDNGDDSLISLIHNGLDSNKLVLSKSGVHITKDTSATENDGAALSVEGGIKAKNLYIKSTDKNNTISGNSITLTGSESITLTGASITLNGKAYATVQPTTDNEIIRLIDLQYNQDYFNNLYAENCSCNCNTLET